MSKDLLNPARSLPSALARRNSGLLPLVILIGLGLFSHLGAALAYSQPGKPVEWGELHWRMIGPHRGGRTVGVAGIPDQANVFYIGVNNGGVWRTSDYGRTWKPVFDNQPTGSIGALAVAPSNPNILYVGSGEGLQRPDLSVGDGIYKSSDGGDTWRHMGLSDAQQIGAVLIHPTNPDRVLVAALGHPYGANDQRGVFLTIDGGSSWQKVLFKDENTGAIALVSDPHNPDIVYADLWSSRQAPWENGEWQGKTSGLYKSADGGLNWKQLTAGLPSADQGLGRIGIAVAPTDPSRLYAVVDAPKLGGIYKSDDAGEHWARTTGENRVWGRGSDFAEVKVHPANRDMIFVANTSVYRSTDAGSTFTAVKGAPGGDDYHSIWINPLHPNIMLVASDQGAIVTVNGGETWSSWYNQPTAQFYHVSTDNEFPYNVYAGQQESGSVGIASRGNDGQITFREWHPVGADEYGYVAPDPLNPSIIYGGRVSRFDKETGQVQIITPEAVRSGKIRYLRTAPLMFSPLDPHLLYSAANVLFKTTTGGQTWEVISPDLSRESPEVPACIGIFRTPELAKQPRRGVIYSLAPSPIDPNLIWAGTDDGLVHITRDGGVHWSDVTPPALTPWSKVSIIDASHTRPGTAFVAVNRIRLDDMRPHIYTTDDFGKTWSEIVKNMPENGPVNVVREDPVRPGLLFAGTERAVHVSFDNGERWSPLRLNMPATSIRDLVVHKSDIVVGTHGRSFWVLDNISALRQADEGLAPAGVTLFRPDTAYRVRWNLNTDTPLPGDEPAGENPPDGAMIDYYLPRDARIVSLDISSSSGPVARFTSADQPDSVNERDLRIPPYWIRKFRKLSDRSGFHRFVWDMHYPPPEGIPRSYPISAVMHATPAEPLGPWVQPGTYTLRLAVDGKTFSQTVTIVMDPRVTISGPLLQEQFEQSMSCYEILGRVQRRSGEIHKLLAQLHGLSQKSIEAHDSCAAIEERIHAYEGTGGSARRDTLAFAADGGKIVRETLLGLQAKALHVMNLIQSADARPTATQSAAARDAQDASRAMEQWWDGFKGGELKRFNRFVTQFHLEPLSLD